MARNHVTQIRSTDHLAKATGDVVEQVKAEVKNQKDPVDAHKHLVENEKPSPKLDTANAVLTQELAKPENKDKAHANPNTKLDSEEKRVASGGESEQTAAKTSENKSKNEVGLSDLEVTAPKTSQAAGGVDTTHKPQPKQENLKDEQDKSNKQKEELAKGFEEQNKH